MDSKCKNRATLIGLAAVVLWSSIVGLIRGVSESFGPTGGAAMMYTVASVFLLFSVGFPQLKTFPKRYLYVGSLLFVAYELCLSLSIGYANSAQQAIEVGMVNYLWPTFTLISAIVFNKQRANFWVIPGFFLSMLGICWVLGGDRGLDFAEMAANVLANPLSYGLAFAGAVIWAAYCTVTTRYAEGKNVLLHAGGGGAVGEVPRGGRWADACEHARYRLPGAGRMCDGLRLCRLERRHSARQRDGAGRGVVFHSGVLRGNIGDVAASAAVLRVLARRGDGVRRLDTLLDGNAIATANRRDVEGG